MTITFNWDIIAFLPIWGVNLGLMSVVGKHMGGGNSDLATASTYSGIKIAIFVASIAAICFFT